MVEQLFAKNLQMIMGERTNIAAMAVLFFIVYIFMLSNGFTKYQKINVKSVLTGILLSISLGAVFSLTLLGREYNPYGRNFELEVFWSYKKALFEGASGLGVEIFCNILLFVPFGILMPEVFDRFKNLWCILVVSVLLSGSIEIIQGVFKLGLFEFDDIISNVMGALIGFGINRLSHYIYRNIKMRGHAV